MMTGEELYNMLHEKYGARLEFMTSLDCEKYAKTPMKETVVGLIRFPNMFSEEFDVIANKSLYDKMVSYGELISCKFLTENFHTVLEYLCAVGKAADRQLYNEFLRIHNIYYFSVNVSGELSSVNLIPEIFSVLHANDNELQQFYYRHDINEAVTNLELALGMMSAIDSLKRLDYSDEELKAIFESNEKLDKLTV